MTAARGTGFADHVRDAGIREEARDHVGVTCRGHGRCLGVEVEPEHSEAAIIAGQVDRPRADRLVAVDELVTGVPVHDLALGVPS
jgi:hypothetical protein